MRTPEERIQAALSALDYYAQRNAYGDAVLFAKAALLDQDVDAFLADEHDFCCEMCGCRRRIGVCCADCYGTPRLPRTPQKPV